MSFKILSFSVSLYCGKKRSKDKTYWHSLSLNCRYIGQKRRKWFSSSVRFKLPISHNRSLASTLRYHCPSILLKEEFRFWTDWQNIHRLHCGIINVTYSSLLGFILNTASVFNLGLEKGTWGNGLTASPVMHASRVSNPAVPVWGFQRSSIVSPFSMWLGDQR